MPAHGIASFVRPAYIMKGQLKSTGFGWPRISFPQWLGNYSKTGKYARQLRELQVHTRLHGYSDAAELNKWYVPALSQAITTPLVNEGTDGVEHVVDIMKEYTLLREDWDNIQDLCTFKGITQPPKIETKAKSAFTRAYKNAGILLPYAERLDKPRRTAASNGSAGAEALVGGDEGGIAQDVVELDDEEDDDDSVVLKQKKPSAKGKGKATAKKPVAKKGKGKL
ncbi:hypothetical protein SARC_08021 [Sphaeroforma arctica JP610]|uniref:DNA replication factor RFC1 C-terminal domain-containing protein n=1 Tax=Sphaeroforma arctica JP610 TaxID=667725 RepID=A0A0L0FUK2_9EUKA|nr:hypothetical protein SARC_08021 [Sphaeroforma arctica JP610]KNC79588.1 hypothetical protein SARC_08021 [Sphaeroforma arctica JP610]|eukprot:XP_014153490.1 hypothetical protein SARC_08021 [Sphaeroforma arctica JP610]